MIDQLTDIAEIGQMVDRVTDDLLQHVATGPLSADAHSRLMERVSRLYNVARTLQPSGAAQ